MINKRADVSEYLDTEKGEDSGLSFVASLPNEEIICGCNGVTKGEIVNAIETQGLTSIEEVKGCTNASRSCGGCKPLVADILELTLGDEFSKSNQKEAICSCTTLSRDEVVACNSRNESNEHKRSDECSWLEYEWWMFEM